MKTHLLCFLWVYRDTGILHYEHIFLSLHQTGKEEEKLWRGRKINYSSTIPSLLLAWSSSAVPKYLVGIEMSIEQAGIHHWRIRATRFKCTQRQGLLVAWGTTRGEGDASWASASCFLTLQKAHSHTECSTYKNHQFDVHFSCLWRTHMRIQMQTHTLQTQRTTSQLGFFLMLVISGKNEMNIS